MLFWFVSWKVICRLVHCQNLFLNDLPFTTSLADVFKCSTQNIKVPVSSTDRLEMVRLWTCPLALIRKWFVGLSWIPFLIQVPVTWGWESSTSKDAVSLSMVLMSVSPLLIVIFRAVKKIGKLLKENITAIQQVHLALYVIGILYVLVLLSIMRTE